MPFIQNEDVETTSNICNESVLIPARTGEGIIFHIQADSGKPCGGCRMVFNPETGYFELKSTDSGRNCVDEKAPIAMTIKS